MTDLVKCDRCGTPFSIQTAGIRSTWSGEYMVQYFTCPGCGDRHELFGKSRAEELARKHAIPAVCRMPLDPAVAGLVDEGKVEQAGAEGLIGAIAMLETLK